MNRGNLAEDPKTGLSSSSRYSRDGGEKNSLLYVDSSQVRKERRASGRKAGKSNGEIRGNHSSGRRKSAGRNPVNSHMDRLEVGSDGRLFQVKESIQTKGSRQKKGSVPDQERKTAATSALRAASQKSTAFSADASIEKHTKEMIQAQDIRPAIAAGVLSALSDRDSNLTDTESSKQTGTDSARSSSGYSKPEREYLSRKNPLLNVALPAGGSMAIARPARLSGGSVRSFFQRIRILIIVCVIALVSVWYGYMAWHYRNRFYPGTAFFGIQAAEQSVYDVKAAVKAKVDSYRLQLVARVPKADPSVPDAAADGAVSSADENIIMAEDVNMTYRDRGEIDRVMKEQKSWAWPVMMVARLFDRRESSLETSYDDSLVPGAVGRLACMQKENMIRPQDAKVVLTDDGAHVQTEIYGTTLDTERTEEAVRKALREGETRIDLDGEGLYVNPKVFSSDLSLVSQAMAMNRILGAKVLIRFGDRTEVINSETISRFLDKNGTSYSLNEDRIRRYVERLAKKYDTYQCRRDFFTSIGTEITLEEGIGDYGWQMDQEATYEKILDAIYSQKKLTIDPVYAREAYCRGVNDIGDTYVEISLTNQTMWFYRDGELVVKTPVVTGNPYTGHETPSGGVWSLKGRMRNQTLVGQGYASPVDYWMPFNGGVGIHDMQSRWWFGGSVYLGSGSHGCVNTPLAAVKLIYDRIEEGVPVIVYKDESEEALSLVTGPTDVQTINAQTEELYGTVEDDGAGSVVAWTRAAAAQAQAAAAQAQAASSGTPVT